MIPFRRARAFPVSRFQRLGHWCVPVLVMLLGSVSIVGVHAGTVSFSSRPSQDFLVLLAITEVMMAIWIFLFSPLPPHLRVLAIAGFLSAQSGLFQMIRLDGFAGDGRPNWTWRWSSTPGSALDWDGKQTSPAAGPVDLSRTTAFDYPGFRGSDRTGRATTPLLSDDWKAFPPRLLWRRAVGSGWSSFAIVGDYCVTQEQRGEFEVTVCYELRSGAERWSHSERAQFFEVTSGDGPRATPTVHAGRVYAIGATGILNCLDGGNGQPIWTVNVLDDCVAENRLFGVTGSPLIVGAMVIVNGGGVGSALVAYDVKSGKQMWRAGSAGASYSSPQLATLCGKQQVLDFNAEGLYGHDLQTGQVRWSVPWISNPAERNNVCQPVVCSEITGEGPNQLFISSGYGMGCALLELGKRDESFSIVERWRNRNLKAKFSSVVIVDGYAYGFDNAILTCVELSSGQRCWKNGRYGFGQLLVADSKLLVQLESGEVALVEASPARFRELGRFPALNGRTWNHPALAGRYLVVRNDREAACYELALTD
jgi:outer membrane protein assembly factor BamB